MRRFDEKIEIAAGNENRTPNHGVAKTSQFSSLFALGIAIPRIWEKHIPNQVLTNPKSWIHNYAIRGHAAFASGRRCSLKVQEPCTEER